MQNTILINTTNIRKECLPQRAQSPQRILIVLYLKKIFASLARSAGKLLLILFLFSSLDSLFPQSIPDSGRTINRVISADANRNLRIPFVDLRIREPGSNRETALSIQLLLLLAVITLAPSILILMTSFLRISIVLDFVKRALSLQQVPPNQLLMGIALFLTLFIMWPTLSVIYEDSFKPFSEGKISLEEMYVKAENPLRLFMYKQLSASPENIRLFMKISNRPKPNTLADVPTYVLIPAFVLHELTVAFKIGILLFIPFIIIDMVVASTLMSMGMIMLPPIMISMPFKLILFVLVNGWDLITYQLIKSYF